MAEFMHQDRQHHSGHPDEQFANPERHIIVNTADIQGRDEASNQPKERLYARVKTEKIERKVVGGRVHGVGK